MKNKNIVTLVNAGVLKTTALTLDAKGAYTLHKFRKALEAAYKSIVDEQGELLKQVGIEDPARVNARLTELSAKEDLAEQESKELNALKATDDKFGKLVAELYEDEASLVITPLSYEDWHALRKENAVLADNYIESILEGVLWEME